MMIITEDIFKQILTESGIRHIRDLANRYDSAKIYFHMDTDGVTTAIAMKYYLENYGIKIVDCEAIQYGDKEFAIKKPMARGDIMPVLVDFAHGKPMFIIHTDHHDKQIGAVKDTSKSFRQARSNVETISQIVSPKELFPHLDVLMISTVDSANYAKMDIKPEQVMNFVFVLDKEKDLEHNKRMMALVTNKLLLAYKNKPKFLERLVMESTPSLLNIYQNIVKMAREEGYISPEAMSQNAKIYGESMKTSENVRYDQVTGIISQYGGGPLFKPGAYDRYVPFKNFPDANFLIMAWPLGLLQASCNPFKSERTIKGVNLGEIAQKVLSKLEDPLKNFVVTIDTLKYFAEKHKSFESESVGFTYRDLVAIYGDTGNGIQDLNTLPQGTSPEYTLERWQSALKRIMDKPYSTLSDRERQALKMLSISGWDIIQANSGGHKCITNISGLMYFGKAGNQFLKQLQAEFEKELKIAVFEDLKAITPVIGAPKEVNEGIGSFIEDITARKRAKEILNLVRDMIYDADRLYFDNEEDGESVRDILSDFTANSTVWLNKSRREICIVAPRNSRVRTLCSYPNEKDFNNTRKEFYSLIKDIPQDKLRINIKNDTITPIPDIFDKLYEREL